LNAFLPELQKSNQELKEKMLKGESVDIEVVDETQEHIEMVIF
jgi:hypothetical protein